MAFNYSPKIVTDGLVLYLDAANSKSYVSGSTTWNDISRSGINGTLVNGPTFTGSNGGSIVFDGVNDYVSLNNNTTTQFSNTDPWSFSITTELLSQNTAYPSILNKGSAATTGLLLFYYSSGSIVLKHNNLQPNPIIVPMNILYGSTRNFRRTNCTQYRWFSCILTVREFIQS